MLRPLCLAAACGLFMPGCIIVVDHDHETRWVHDEGSGHGRIGIYLESPDSTLAAQLGLDADHACVISGIQTDSPADKAGLKRHDVVTSVDGDAAASASRVRQAIRSHKPGEEISLGILRQGKPMTITVPVH